MKRILKRVNKKVVVAGAMAVSAVSAMADGVTMPTPDYTNIDSAFTTGAGVVLTVSLLFAGYKFLKAR